jgi:hypothetical protein
MYYRRYELIIACRCPVEAFAKVGKRSVRHDGAAGVLDPVQHLGDVTAAHVVYPKITDGRLNQPIKGPLVLPGAAQLPADVPRHELVQQIRDSLNRRRPHAIIKRVFATVNALA